LTSCVVRKALNIARILNALLQDCIGACCVFYITVCYTNQLEVQNGDSHACARVTRQDSGGMLLENISFDYKPTKHTEIMTRASCEIHKM